MIQVRIFGQSEKRFNGLLVKINVEESDGKGCKHCEAEKNETLTRCFNVARIMRGAVSLRQDSGFFREVQRFVQDKMGHGDSMCEDCFEELVDSELGGFEPAD